MNMNVLSNLQFQGSSPILEHLADFPATPTDGQLVLVNGIIYIYTTLQGTSTWYPLTNENYSFIHTQGLETTTWTVNHNLGTSEYMFFVYDETNKLIQPSYEYIDDNTFELNFTVATKGKAVVFAAAAAISDTLSSDSFNYVYTDIDYISSSSDFIFVDTSASEVSITLPSAPAINDKVSIHDSKSAFDVTNCLIASTFPIMGTTDGVIINIKDITVELIFNGTEWRII